jgi:hypothetical protein
VYVGYSTPTVTGEYQALKPPEKRKLPKIQPFQNTATFCLIFGMAEPMACFWHILGYVTSQRINYHYRGLL